MATRHFAYLAAVCALALACGCAHHRPTPQRALDDGVATPATANASRGAALYAKNCAACHGARGSAGPVGPPLAGEGHRKHRAQIIDAIDHPDPPMPKLFPGRLSAQDVADLTAFVETL
jgi:mono/diheme cytochrome c family protein